MRALNTKLLGHLIQTATPNATWKAAVAVQVRARCTQQKVTVQFCPKAVLRSLARWWSVDWTVTGLITWAVVLHREKKFVSPDTRSFGFKSVPVCDEGSLIIVSGVAASLRIVLALCVRDGGVTDSKAGIARKRPRARSVQVGVHCGGCLLCATVCVQWFHCVIKGIIRHGHFCPGCRPFRSTHPWPPTRACARQNGNEIQAQGR